MSANLESRIQKYKEIDLNIADRIKRVSQIHENYLSAHESFCFDLVKFDEDLNSLYNCLFTNRSRKDGKKNKDEIREILLSTLSITQDMADKELIEYFLSIDPVIRRIREEHNMVIEFEKKHKKIIFK